MEVLLGWKEKEGDKQQDLDQNMARQVETNVTSSDQFQTGKDTEPCQNRLHYVKI